MLRMMRSHAAGPVTKTMLVLLIASFAAWGIGDYIGGNRSGAGMWVNGHGVHVNEIQRSYRNMLEQVSRQFGQELSPEALAQLGVAREVLANEMQRILVLDEAKDMGLAVSDNELLAQIKEVPAFAGEDGEFDENVYKTIVGSMGLTTEAFEKQMTEQAMITMMSSAFNGAKPADAMVRKLLEHEHASVDVRVVEVPFAKTPKVAVPSEEEMREVFEETRAKNEIMAPEFRSARVMTVSLAEIAKGIRVSDEEIKSEYDGSDFSVPEERKAAHILVKSEDEAKAIKADIEAGADFAAVAKEKSIDTFSGKNGGELGFFKASDMVPEFSDAAFAMEVGSVSEPVKSNFGWHIIKMLDVKEASKMPFAEVKGEIKTSMQRARAEEIYEELLQQVDDRIAGGEFLDSIAVEMKLPLKEYSGFSENGATEDEVAPPAPDVIRSAFEMAIGEVSPPMNAEGDDSTMFVEVTDVKPEHALSFEEVKESLEAAMVAERKRNAAREVAEKLLAKMAKGDGDVVARRAGFSSKMEEKLLRTGRNSPNWLAKNSLEELFAAEAGKGVVAQNGDSMMIAQLVAKHEAELDDAVINGAKMSVQRQMNDELMREYMANLYMHAKVSYNIPLLRRVFGEQFDASQTPVPENSGGVLSFVKRFLG